MALRGDWQATEAFDVQTSFSAVDSETEYGYDEDWAFPEICSGLPCDGWAYSSEDNYLRDRDNRVIDIKLVSSKPIAVLSTQLDWVAGVYARDQDEQLLRQYTYNTSDFVSDFDTSNRAIYGQFELSLTDRTTLVTGLRFERRDARYDDSDGVVHSVDENLVGGRLAVQYKPHQNTMIYALLSRGYKAGGVNSDPALAPEDRDFDTETMWNAEVGIKGSWLNEQLQAQVSAFHQNRRDIQIKQSLVQSRDDSNASDFIDYFGNSAEGYNRGLEVEFDWTVAENLMVYGSLGMLSSEYDTPLSETLDAREQAHAPSYQFALGSLVRLNDSLRWQILVEGKDAFYLSSSHDERSQSYRLLNTRLTYDVGQWELSLWGRNLTDEEVIVRGFGGFGNDPRKFYETEPYYQLGEPRVFGISGTYQFN
jgi:outer membrane receptor protein involved in Fe transport